jgi:plastocyanin
MKQKILIAAGIVALVVVVAFIVLGARKGTAPGTETGGSDSLPGAPVGDGQRPVTKPTGQPKFTVSVTSPLAGAKWEIGKLNTISWNKAAGVSGIIYLMTKAGAVSGVILPTIGPDQTSYSWDTTYVAVSATNASRNSVVPGEYKIRLVFSGNNLPVTDSGVITLVRPGTPEMVSAVAMQGYAFVPKNFSVPKGQKVTFTNKDSVQHHLAVTGVLNSIPLNSGESYTLDTSSLQAGKTYSIFCDLHPDMTGTMTVTAQ